MIDPDWKIEFDKLNLYRVSLEASRRDLMSGNEELRDKLMALERGQIELQNLLTLVLGHSECACEMCVRAWHRFKNKERVRRSLNGA